MKTIKYVLVTADHRELYFDHWLDMISAMATMIDKGETVCVKKLDERITNDEKCC